MKKFFCVLLSVLIITTPYKKTSALGVSAQFACVIDAMTGNVLYEKNAYKKHSMASTTKIMTALVALENSSLNDIVTASANAAGTEGSSIYLKPGEEITMEDLLYGLMLASGNDAAIAIAEHVGGDVETFARMMTKKAKEIGAKNTSFKNPNGLDAEDHFTTAYDLALITRYAMQNDKFKEIVSSKTKTISNGTENYKRTLTNHNKLLSQYPGCIGVKTGFTKKTGRCLVSAAEKNGFRVICVTLNAPDDWNDHKNMLNFAFDTYKAKPLIIKDMILKTIPVENGSSHRLELLADSDYYITLTSESVLSDIKLDYKTPSKIKAPIKKGEQ
ncbi:MAG: D-alanyl-D-alanine carboxypeptidase, partial [Clostridia bacterium]|nr:D-alanyl-D-alanine carboxypeptidase [Clostridia bacterium]